jgi:hypothetical protein
LELTRVFAGISGKYSRNVTYAIGRKPTRILEALPLSKNDQAGNDQAGALCALLESGVVFGLKSIGFFCCVVLEIQNGGADLAHRASALLIGGVAHQERVADRGFRNRLLRLQCAIATKNGICPIKWNDRYHLIEKDCDEKP